MSEPRSSQRQQARQRPFKGNAEATRSSLRRLRIAAVGVCGFELVGKSTVPRIYSTDNKPSPMIYRPFNQQACDALLAQGLDEINPNVKMRCDTLFWSRGKSNCDRQRYEKAMNRALALSVQWAGRFLQDLLWAIPLSTKDGRATIWKYGGGTMAARGSTYLPTTVIT